MIRFAKYREVREALHNFEGVLLACLALAFEELSPHLQFMSEVKYCFLFLKCAAYGY